MIILQSLVKHMYAESDDKVPPFHRDLGAIAEKHYATNTLASAKRASEAGCVTLNRGGRLFYAKAPPSKEQISRISQNAN
jgi:hypothetical protein